MELEIVQWIVNQGVAVAVTGFLLIRIENKLDQLIAAVAELHP